MAVESRATHTCLIYVSKCYLTPLSYAVRPIKTGQELNLSCLLFEFFVRITLEDKTRRSIHDYSPHENETC